MGRRKVGPIRIHKKEIDLQTGVHHNWAQDIVGPITATFLEEIIRLLLDGYEVYLKDFGTFRLVTRKGRAVTTLKKGTFKKGESCGTTTVDVRNKHYIVFKKSIHLRERIKERFGKERVLHPEEPPHGKIRPNLSMISSQNARKTSQNEQAAIPPEDRARPLSKMRPAQPRTRKGSL